MENSVLISATDGELLTGLLLYGYRPKNTGDSRIRIVTAEQDAHGFPTIITRILVDSEDYDGQSGVYDAFEIHYGTGIHEHLDGESNSGWLEGGRTYKAGDQIVVTLTANELLNINGSMLIIGQANRTILY